MTATLDSPAAVRPSPADDVDAWVIGSARLLAGLCNGASPDLRTHLATHGPLPGTDLDHLLQLLDAVGGLAGRGGAGFPLAAKLRSLAGRPGHRRVVVNGTESEPASFKDRVLLRGAPHLVLDGALAVAASVGARRITVALHDVATAARVRAAAVERPDRRRIEVRVLGGGSSPARPAPSSGPWPAARRCRRVGAPRRPPPARCCPTRRPSRRWRCCCASGHSASPRPAPPTSRARPC